MNIGYIVHDLNDAAVAKRCAMFERGGAGVALAGYFRGSPPAEICGLAPMALAETNDADLTGRTGAVIGNILAPAKLRDFLSDCDVIVARNLESLALARRIAGGRPVVYECLDIHRSLLGRGVAARAIQVAEALLIDGVAGIITSSPAFIREYFDRRPTGKADIRLEENRILLAHDRLPQDAEAPLAKPAGPPWRIGWFGMLRCERTFEELSALASALDGKVEVLVAGKPSPAELPDFEERVAQAAHMEFLGPYKPADIASLYARCHFAWTIDWFEEGQNSEWLLPNRLYEATANGTVPIVLQRHEVGRWLRLEGAGLRIETTDGLEGYFRQLDRLSYERHREAIDAIDRNAIMAGDRECVELVGWIEGLQ